MSYYYDNTLVWLLSIPICLGRFRQPGKKEYSQVRYYYPEKFVEVKV